MPDEKVKAVCIQRTADAKAAVEREIQDMRHEREQQIAVTNKNVSDLNQALAILTKDVTDLVGDEKTQRERMDSQDKLIAQGARQMELVLDWQKEELARHTREEIEKKDAIARVESDRKERSKPWLQLVFNILEKFVWILLTGALAWMAYMLALAKGMMK